MEPDEPIVIEDTKVYSVHLSHPEGRRRPLKWKKIRRWIKKIQNQDHGSIEGSGTCEFVGTNFEELIERLKNGTENK